MSKNSRCECCTKVMGELLTFRQSFEKLFKSLNKQIAELRREVRQNNNNNNKRNINLLAEQRNTLRNASMSSHTSDNDTMEPTTRLRQSKRLKLQKVDNAALFVQELHEPLVQIDDAVFVDSDVEAHRTASEFFSIHSRIIPARPFASAAEFDDWDLVLASDEDQRDLLRIELLQDHYDNPEAYVKTIWQRLLASEVAWTFTRGANLKFGKKSIKSYTFFDIFKECFLQRFEKLNEGYFVEHTMRYFLNSKRPMAQRKRNVDVVDEFADDDESLQ